MWLYQKIKSKYNAFKKNVRRRWVKWPMWVAAPRVKGMTYTNGLIYFPGQETRTLFRTEGLAGTQWYSCELDDEGWGYFGGNQYLIKEGIMSAGTPQSNYPGFTNSIFDSILAGNKYNGLKYKDNYIYCATNDNITGILRKLDISGNVIWSKTHGTVSFFNAVDVDDSGNVYACGNGYIIKYNSSGTEQWAVASNDDLDIIYENNYIYSCGNLTQTTGGIKILDTNGNNVGNFGTQAWQRDNTGPYYRNIAIDSKYIYALSNDTNQAIDIYDKAKGLSGGAGAFTFSTYTSGVTGWPADNVRRMTDIEIYDGVVYTCDFTTGDIYKLNSTFSRVEDSWGAYANVQAIKFRYTY